MVIKFSINSKSSEIELKKIELKVKNNIKLAFGERLPKSVEEHFEELLEIPFEKGVQRFIQYLNENQINISTDLQIEIFEYVYHAIDSKPIGNELGIEWALKSVFKNQLNLERPRSCQIEETVDGSMPPRTHKSHNRRFDPGLHRPPQVAGLLQRRTKRHVVRRTRTVIRDLQPCA